MKKNYFMLAAAAMMFAACSETDMVSEMGEMEKAQEISFESFANKTTRAVAASSELESYHDSFGVWAYKTTKTDGPVMPNYKVEATGGTTKTWEYKNVTGQSIKYWDKQAKYSFYAYAPYAATGVTLNNSTGAISIVTGTYAANENLQARFATTLNTSKFTGIGTSESSKSTDWMIADAITGYNNYTDLVPEVFSHIMSKLIVKVQSSIADTKINSISVNNVHGRGSYNGSAWTTDGAATSITGVGGNIASASTPYYSMEYLLIPSTDDPTLTIEYTLSGDTYSVTQPITDITEFAINTKYEVNVKISPAAIEFSATASDFTVSADDEVVEIN